MWFRRHEAHEALKILVVSQVSLTPIGLAWQLTIPGDELFFSVSYKEQNGSNRVILAAALTLVVAAASSTI